VSGLLGFKGLRRANRHQKAGTALYGVAVAAARTPWFYRVLGVPDTLDGRFDLVALHAFLLIDRLRHAQSPGPALAQAVFDAMFSDMDMNLREMGVGDLSVGRKVRVMWEAFHGRAAVYAAALQAGDIAALEAALERNVWRGAPAPDGASEALTRAALAQHRHLATRSLNDLVRGVVDFLPAGEAAR